MAERLLKRWHRELNALCFNGELPECTFHVGTSTEKRKGWTKDDWAEGEYHPNGYGKGMILIDPRAPDHKATLAHEMIHQWQDLTGNRLDHGHLFKGWADHIKEVTGLCP